MEPGPESGEHVCLQLYKGDRVDVGSQKDMSTHTDACIHYNQGVGPDEG